MNCAMNRNGDHGVDLLRESQLKTIMLGQPTALDLGKALRAVARASNYNKKLFARAPARARQAQSRAQRLVVSEQAAKSQEKEAAAEQREEHKRQRDAAVSDLMSTLHAQMTIIGMRADVGLPRAEATEVGSQLAAIQHCIQLYLQRLEQGIVDHDKSARVLMQRSLEREVRIQRMLGEEATASAGSLLAQEVMRAKVAGRWRCVRRVGGTAPSSASCAPAREAVDRLRTSERKVSELQQRP